MDYSKESLNPYRQLTRAEASASNAYERAEAISNDVKALALKYAQDAAEEMKFWSLAPSDLKSLASWFEEAMREHFDIPDPDEAAQDARDRDYYRDY